MARLNLPLCLFALCLMGVARSRHTKFTIETCVEVAREECRRAVAFFNAFGSPLTLEQCLENMRKNECPKRVHIYNTFFGRDKRSTGSDEIDDSMESGMDQCMDRMKGNQMMVSMFPTEQMKAICRNRVRTAIQVSGMTRNDQQQRVASMGHRARHFFSSLGNPHSQGQSKVGQGQDPARLTLSSQMKQGKKMCMDRMEKNHMMMSMCTKEQMKGLCRNEVTWLIKTAEAKKRDPTMRQKMDSMSKPVKSYFSSLGKNNRNRRSNHPTAKPRKEYRMLTAKELQSFHDAVNAMKNTMLDADTSQYDSFSDFHQIIVSPAAHFGAAFLGWHREYLIRFERALQRHNPSVMIPYWDSTLDNNLGDLANRSIMWSEDFMGNVQGPVVTGPFANWEVPRPSFGRDGLWRVGGGWSNGSLLMDEQVDAIISINDFRNMTWHVNQVVESLHGLPHLWVGGPMGDIENSPSDPIFATHHAFVDMIWELQEQRVFREGRKSEYVYPPASDEEAYGVGEDQITSDIILTDPRDSFHFITNPMLPFDNLFNADGLRDTYRLFYYYDPRPTCSKSKPTCGSPYLFCIDAVYKCAPKLQLGASCKGFESSDSCYGGICENGVCSSIRKC